MLKSLSSALYMHEYIDISCNSRYISACILLWWYGDATGFDRNPHRTHLPPPCKDNTPYTRSFWEPCLSLRLASSLDWYSRLYSILVLHTLCRMFYRCFALLVGSFVLLPISLGL